MAFWKNTRHPFVHLALVSLALLFLGMPLPAFAGTPTQLVFDTPLPSNHLNGFQLTTVKVDVEDSTNAIVTTSTASITLTLIGPGLTTSVMTHNASSGVWTFNYSSLALTNPGLYTMVATSGTLTAASQSIGITVAMVAPQNTILSGVYANDGDDASLTGIANLESAVGTALGRTFTYAIDMHYYAFTATGLQTNAAFETSIGTDVANNRIPLVSWHCPAIGSGTVTDIAAGTYDTTITNVAKALAAHHGPVLMRWFWEMNLLSATKNDETWSCLGYPSGSNPTTTQISTGESDFINAWNHIQSIFQTNHASNVIWLWNPGAGNDTAPGGTQVGTYTDNFYPSTNSVNGWSAVDWVGIDAYNRLNDAFQNTFFNGTAYNGNTGDASYGYGEQVAHGKPILIAENGALYTSESHQITYFDAGADALKTYFPSTLGYMYFDSDAALDWDFTTASSPTGLSEYSAMEGSAYLGAVSPASGVAYSLEPFNAHIYVATASATITHGTATTINAEIGSTTLATNAPTGNVTIYYYDTATSTLSSATAVALSCTAGNYCKASTSITFSAAHTYYITAVYAGDSHYDGGQSWPIVINVQ